MNNILDTYKTATGRERILLAGFQEMHQNGYQGMRIDAILKATGLAKGALYHHFPNKISLAYAIIDEILFEHSKEHFTKALNEHDDPIIANCNVLKEQCTMSSEEDIALGCPLNNLSQEMSGLDEGFKNRLKKIYAAWIDMISTSLSNGIKKGYVKPGIDTEQTAVFIICSYQGIIGAAKCMQSKEFLNAQINMLCNYIETLRNNEPAP